MVVKGGVCTTVLTSHSFVYECAPRKVTGSTFIKDEMVPRSFLFLFPFFPTVKSCRRRM